MWFCWLFSLNLSNISKYKPINEKNKHYAWTKPVSIPSFCHQFKKFVFYISYYVCLLTLPTSWKWSMLCSLQLWNGGGELWAKLVGKRNTLLNKYQVNKFIHSIYETRLCSGLEKCSWRRKKGVQKECLLSLPVA